MSNNNRPAWAKKIPAKVWRELRKCQSKTPTLKGLKADLKLQAEWKITCDTCSAAARAIDLI